MVTLVAAHKTDTRLTSLCSVHLSILTGLSRSSRTPTMKSTEGVSAVRVLTFFFFSFFFRPRPVKVRRVRGHTMADSRFILSAQSKLFYNSRLVDGCSVAKNMTRKEKKTGACQCWKWKKLFPPPKTDEQLDNQLLPNLFCLQMGIDQGEIKEKNQGFCFKILC